MIEPVMSAEEWKAPQDVIAGYVDVDSGIIDVTIGGPGGADRPRSTWALIALLNSWLSDSDPRKITREWVESLRKEAERGRLAERVGDNAGYSSIDPDLADQMADALESYLPPPV
jgi:hypothetical protein